LLTGISLVIIYWYLNEFSLWSDFLKIYFVSVKTNTLVCCCINRGLRTSPKPSSNLPARTAPAAPAHPPAAAPATGVAQPQQPGMFAQMATTAAGVAVGSAVVSGDLVLITSRADKTSFHVLVTDN